MPRAGQSTRLLRHYWQLVILTLGLLDLQMFPTPGWFSDSCIFAVVAACLGLLFGCGMEASGGSQAILATYSYKRPLLHGLFTARPPASHHFLVLLGGLLDHLNEKERKFSHLAWLLNWPLASSIATVIIAGTATSHVTGPPTRHWRHSG